MDSLRISLRYEEVLKLRLLVLMVGTGVVCPPTVQLLQASQPVMLHVLHTPTEEAHTVTFALKQHAAGLSLTLEYLQIITHTDRCYALD
eukprot:1795873-Amphidinium_carterae.2